MQSQVLYGHIFGILFFDDPESVLSLAGTGLLGVGVVTVNLRGGTRKQPDQAMLPINAAAAEQGPEDGEEAQLELVEVPQVSTFQRDQERSALIPQWSGIEAPHEDRVVHRGA